MELAEQHIFVLEDRLTPDEIRQRAMDRRTGAFGTGLSGASAQAFRSSSRMTRAQDR